MAKRKLLVLVLLAGLMVGSVGRASALLGGTIGTAIKVFGIGYAVRVFGPQINSFINSVMAQRGIEREGGTKVVPILSVGQGLYIGAAQVMGPTSRVDNVRSVAQGEVTLGEVRLNGLFPLNATVPLITPTSTVPGVGISAIIDFNV
ncbi:MAG TPA: hypothetical protein GX715_16975 [Armatimonadetes bacterium]|jgi:hypothetical protein|nr:hypothetical protein [Armatimonadota bacterium]